MNFPQELINLVIECSEGDLRTLVALCLVSRACFYAARPLLYRKVELVSSWDPKALVSGNVLFSIISSNSQLASYVREFTLDVACYLRNSESHVSTLFSDLRQALNSMTRLKKLRFILPDKLDEDFPTEPTLLGHNFQLEEFYWRDFRWYVRFESRLDKFLAFQSRIRTLEMVTGPDAAPSTYTIASTAFPDLETLSGNFRYFQLLAATRPVVNFVWNGVSPVPSSTLDSTSSALSRLRVLVLHEGFPKELDLSVLASHLTSLEVLHLSLEDTRMTIQSYPQIRSGQKIVEHVHKLTKLRVFVLRVEPSQTQFHEHAQRMLSAQWFEMLPHFERAYFNGSAAGSEVLLCWARDEIRRPRISGMEEVYDMYRTEYALEASLLKPFYNNSRPMSCAPDPPTDNLENPETRHSGKHSHLLSTGMRTPWWKKVFWETISQSPAYFDFLLISFISALRF